MFAIGGGEVEGYLHIYFKISNILYEINNLLKNETIINSF